MHCRAVLLCHTALRRSVSPPRLWMPPVVEAATPAPAPGLRSEVSTRSVFQHPHPGVVIENTYQVGGPAAKLNCTAVSAIVLQKLANRLEGVEYEEAKAAQARLSAPGAASMQRARGARVARPRSARTRAGRAQADRRCCAAYRSPARRSSPTSSPPASRTR